MALTLVYGVNAIQQDDGSYVGYIGSWNVKNAQGAITSLRTSCPDYRTTWNVAGIRSKVEGDLHGRLDGKNLHEFMKEVMHQAEAHSKIVAHNIIVSFVRIATMKQKIVVSYESPFLDTSTYEEV